LLRAEVVKSSLDKTNHLSFQAQLQPHNQKRQQLQNVKHLPNERITAESSGPIPKLLPGRSLKEGISSARDCFFE